MTGMTTKQAAQHFRRLLDANAGHMMTYTRRTDDSTFTVHLPELLTFQVRATKAGVNVSIQDDGYVDEITGGDRRSFGPEHADPVTAEVDRLRQMWTPTLGGKTTWGGIFISARATTSRIVSSRTKACDQCWAEVNEWREIAGEIVCIPCSDESMTTTT